MPFGSYQADPRRSAAQCQPQLCVDLRTNISGSFVSVRGVDPATDTVTTFHYDDIYTVSLQGLGGT
jgi:hypothetical protein